MMIAQIIEHEGRPAVPLSGHVVEALGLSPGQRIRVTLEPLPFGAATPLLEPDGTPL